MFEQFVESVAETFRSVSKNGFVVDVPGDVLWKTYINSFSNEFNPVVGARTLHDCNLCKAFIVQYGGVVRIDSDYTLSTIWDNSFRIHGYGNTALAMSSIVKSAGINSRFYTASSKIGHSVSRIKINGSGQYLRHLHGHYDGMISCDVEYEIDRSVSEYNILNFFTQFTSDQIGRAVSLFNSGALLHGDKFVYTLRRIESMLSTRQQLGSASSRNNAVWLMSLRESYGYLNNAYLIDVLHATSRGATFRDVVTMWNSQFARGGNSAESILERKMKDDALQFVIDNGYISDLPIIAFERKFNNDQHVMNRRSIC